MVPTPKTTAAAFVLAQAGVRPAHDGAEIARQLNEVNPQAIAQIDRVVACLDVDIALALLAETLDIEAKGGR